MIPDKPGVYPNVTFDEYRVIAAINWHTLWRMREESPAHALYELQHGSRETEALAFGSLTDFVLLEPGRFEAEAVVEPEIGEGLAPKRPTKRQLEAKKPSPASIQQIQFWAEWDLANAGKLVVTRADYDRVLEIERSVRSAQCREYIIGGRAQVVLVWEDRASGLLCKGRLDYERSAGFNHCITDLKTSRMAKREFFEFAIYKYGYFGQLAFYHDGWAALHEGEPSLCNWLVAEKEGLCVVKPYECGEKTLEAGRNAYRAALDRWAACVKAKDFPAYGGLEIIDMPEWALRQEGVGPELIRPGPVAPAPADNRSFEEIYDLE
jgi:hypothetical protein